MLVVVVVIVVTVAVAIVLLLLLLIMGFGVVEVKGILVKFLLDRDMVVVAVEVVVRVVLLAQLRYGHWLSLGRWSRRHCCVGVYVVKVKEELCVCVCMCE